jgi:hypothetical protein
LPVLIGVVAIISLGCVREENQAAFTGDIAKGNPTAEEAASVTASGEAPEPEPLTADESAELSSALAASGPGCEILDTRSCLLPFPSDAYTVEDEASATGRRVDLPQGLLANADGSTLDVTAWNRNDGFSPSTPILIHVPGLDADLTDLPSEGDIGFSVTPESATLLIDLDTGPSSTCVPSPTATVR